MIFVVVMSSINEASSAHKSDTLAIFKKLMIFGGKLIQTRLLRCFSVNWNIFGNVWLYHCWHLNGTFWNPVLFLQKPKVKMLLMQQ